MNICSYSGSTNSNWLARRLCLGRRPGVFHKIHFLSLCREWSENSVFLNVVLVVVRFSLVARFHSTLNRSEWHLQCSISPSFHWWWSAHLLGKKLTVDKLRVTNNCRAARISYKIKYYLLALIQRRGSTQHWTANSKRRKKCYPHIFILPLSQCWLWSVWLLHLSV